MVERGLVSTRSTARRLIAMGAVAVGDETITRPAKKVDHEARVTIAPDRAQWVSRGAHKLEAALDVFPIDPGGKRCLDVGASTGGFTQVLLTRGALDVVAVDVGTEQIHHTLRHDTRVDVREQTNVRDVTSDDLGGPFPLVVVDLSFISVRVVIDRLAELVDGQGDLVILIKPQFELRKADLGKKGVVRDPARRQEAVMGVIAACSEAGLAPQAIITSPIEGGEGNVEFLLWARKGASIVELEVPF